jgi:alkylation response protein AidB-like acyl-CoA dehydrogenase
MKPQRGLLVRERHCLERYLPGLREKLERTPLLEREKPRGPGIGLFRDAGGAALLVPQRYHGKGASALDAVRVQRAVGALSPSLAVASTMHHFSTAALVELAAGSGMEWLLLQAIAQSDLLLASGFAEGQPGQHVLRPTMTARRVPGGLRVSGAKKPCSLTWSMDLLSASARVDGGEGSDLAVLVVPAKSEGVTRREFWGNWVLAGAESDEIRLEDVFVPDRLVIYPEDPDISRDPVHAKGFVWFEMLISAAYLGMASGLAERVLLSGRAPCADMARLGVELEGAMFALEGLALAFDRDSGGQSGGGQSGGDSDLDSDGNSDLDSDGDSGGGEVDLAGALFVRYTVQQTVERAAMTAAALAGGMAFIGSSEVSYLLAACRALTYHPPSFGTMADALAGYLAGAELTLL